MALDSGKEDIKNLSSADYQMKEWHTAGQDRQRQITKQHEEAQS